MPKLDPELMRQILLKVEAHPPDITVGEIEIEGHGIELISYHIKMLDDAGLLVGMDASTMGGLHWQVKSLTYGGHRLLDAIRSDTAWATVKTEVKKRGLDLTIEVIKAVAASLVNMATGMG